MKFLALLAYFPVFGWFFPMFLAREGSFPRYHARQGFSAFIFFSLCLGVAWLISHSIPTFVGFLEDLLYLTPLGLYLVLSVSGVLAVFKGVERPLPLVGKKAENLPL